LKSTRDANVVPFDEQVEIAKTTNKLHFEKMFEMKEYMEEYCKFKEVIAGMKK